MHCDQIRFIPGMQGPFNIKKLFNTSYHTNKKEKSHDCINQKAFDSDQCPFKIKLRKIGMEKNFLNLIKSMYKTLN